VHARGLRKEAAVRPPTLAPTQPLPPVVHQARRVAALRRAICFPRVLAKAIGQVARPPAAVSLPQRVPAHHAGTALLVVRPLALVAVARGVHHRATPLLHVVHPVAFPRGIIGGCAAGTGLKGLTTGWRQPRAAAKASKALERALKMTCPCPSCTFVIRAPVSIEPQRSAAMACAAGPVALVHCERAFERERAVAMASAADHFPFVDGAWPAVDLR
jgi:hypothetical protein